ncbi:MAG: hypothetical protein COV59_04575 [Candidatus Magasanikbacteria bacterium CG11_big_fil_rev_8_21_14_0_20_39_34]|uniref:Uncharacterized protein n=1 Tax=Candidatus Magasanikbacteria bacterium CG11_big_fil_rev_8_21_14_0_20_39_34 TaxID=1974653 RepID=A0A2H0N4B3_9BACT|nr:MAG: hypothetical protein COV59_04575 [Candidatus Magasanikbacteria bacterium CG11_big_fil_rev_8_21_14_0_20_39_34]
MNLFKKIILSLFSLALLCAPSMTFAYNLGDSGTLFRNLGSKTGIQQDAQIEDIVGAAIRTALTLVGLVFLVLMVYAGYLWMTARGEDSQVEKARKIVYASIIGLVIVMSAYAITVLVTSRLGT